MREYGRPGGDGEAVRMRPGVRRLGLACVAAGVLGAGCSAATTAAGPSIVHPGAPGEAGRTAAAASIPSAAAGVSAADVRFMQDMIHHHAQALEMTALVEARTTRADIRQLALRIEHAQRDEIAQMQRWLRERGVTAPGPSDHSAHHGHGAHPAAHAHEGHTGHDGHHGHAAHDGHLMAGMLTPEQMARLAAARGAEFDRLFLQSMIYHHEGALTMVAELFASPDGGQEGEIFEFAAHVDGDQRIEIGRMERMLAMTP